MNRIEQLSLIKEWKESNSEVLKEAATRLASAWQIIRGKAGGRSFNQSSNQNKMLFGEMQGEQYKNCLLNPDYAAGVFPTEIAAIISALIAVFQSARKDAILGNQKMVWSKTELLLDLAKELAKEVIDRQKIIDSWRSHWVKNISDICEQEIKSLVVKGEDNIYQQILLAANGEDFKWLYNYGCLVDEQELDLAQFFFSYPPDQLTAMAERIVNAFLHGFISQSRERRDRRGVRLAYQLGQEALAQKVFYSLQARGLEPIITEPQSLGSGMQYDLDHSFDHALIVTAAPSWDWLNRIENGYRRAMEKYSTGLLDTCGMIGISQFGSPPTTLARAKKAFIPNSEQTLLFKKATSRKRALESQYLSPGNLSFCKVTFPNQLVGKGFNQIFDQIFALNLVDSKPYELIQQLLIDALDQCERVRILGSGRNQTDLSISLFPLARPESQSNYLNCGGDLNIPHGEVFTTPRLQGTKGLWHIPEIYLGGKYYKDLRLTFDQGMIIDYACQNFADEQQNREYIAKQLLFPHQSLPIGEFALGTNTKLYQMTTKYGLFSRLPILLAEKMGPHIALGDPCFARGEEAPVYNLYNQKEMVARQNEITAQRSTCDVYTDKHIDITLPYDQIALLSAYTKTGKEIEFIKNGRFVLKGTEALNIPLDQLKGGNDHQ